MHSMRVRLLIIVIIAGLLFVTWHFSPYEPLIREPISYWLPLAFTSDGTTLAVSSTDGVRFLSADTLVETEPPLQLPRAVWSANHSFLAPIELFEFSPDGRTIAVIQLHRDGGLSNTYEMFIIDRASREIE